MASQTLQQRAGKKVCYSHERPRHSVTYPRMTERQKAAHIESIENLRAAIQMQKLRKKAKL